MGKKIAGILLIFCVLLAGVFYRMQSGIDRTPPKIEISSEEIVYEEGKDKAVLLEGVTAIDAVDGDVSDTLVVDSILPMEGKAKATVIYYAKDKSNNVAKETRVVGWLQAGEEWQKEETEQAQEKETKTPKKKTSESEAEASGTEGTETETSEAEETKTAETGDSEPEKSETETSKTDENPAAPKIELTVREVKIHKGESFDPLAYVKDIKDDKDSREHLFGQIHIEKNTVDIWNNGKYEVVYSVTDKDGNCSTFSTLKVVVEE